MSGDEHPDALPPGTAIDRFTIVRRIGAGGMGEVYEAVHAELGKRVAIKTLHPEVARTAEGRARFLREGKAATKIRHPHVVDVTDVGVWNGTPYLVMEFLEGEDLASLIQRDGALPIDRVAEILLPVISAVGAAHDEGIVHRDLKPENIFLARVRHGGVVPKLLDFGISKMSEGAGGRALTGSGALMGTPYYMSPEQAAGQRQVDARSDQYALGVILYECISGRRPFVGETLLRVLNDIVNGSFAPLRTVCPNVPEAIDSAVQIAMRVDPGTRYPNVAALGNVLFPFATAGVQALWQPSFGTNAVVAAPPPAVRVSAAGTATPSMLHGTTLQRSVREVELVGPAARTRRGAVAAVALLVALGVGVAGTLFVVQRRTPQSVPAASVPAAVSPTPIVQAAPVALPVAPPPAPPPVANTSVDAGVASTAQHEAPAAAPHRAHHTAHHGETHEANGSVIISE